MKKKLSRNQLKKWLKKGANVALLSISLMGGANINFQMNNNITPQFFLSKVNIDDYPTGHYLVDYKYQDNSNKPEPDPLYCEVVLAMYYDVVLKSGGVIKNIENLENKLSEHSYILISDDRKSASRLKTILVKKPDYPNELYELVNTLNEDAAFVSVHEDKTNLFAHAYVNGKRVPEQEAKSYHQGIVLQQ
ncbi:hypothetical protein CWC14_05965 [Pseudoalteromonas sp. S3260]|uniref:hypothetical protein n=1 Tax=Pseudoalteromonas sp. S3260 TaxID=579534 RepID=UPI00110AF4C2|nr:hypothetical protein [Pseudoalteromonas sp. S3260]TMO98717.1 hypothetical protein CWC14_05965 [Pseudoalteromonas sp. S3260]